MFTEILSTARKADREQLVRDMRKALEPLGVKVTERTYCDSHDISIGLEGPGVSAGVSLWAKYKTQPSIISWHNAERRLTYRYFWGAPNQFHGRKATSFPNTFNDLIEMLVAGFTAAADGSAFAKEEQV